MEDFPLNRSGRIASGKYAGWKVRVVECEPGSDDCLVLIARPDHGESYDDWVEKRKYLPEFFTNRKWDVEWES